MGIQINGQTDTVSSTTSGGKVTITPFNGNVGTGASISSPATNVLTLGTNNTESVRINSTGVGIGTNNPASTLDVGGEITIRRTAAGNEGGQINFARASDNAVAWNIDAYGSTSTPSLRFIDNTAAVVRMEIDGSGRVTTPYQPRAHIRKTTSTSVSTTSTKITFDAASYDIGSNYSDANDRYTAPITGYYLVCLNLNIPASGSNITVAVAKNGATYQGMDYTTVGANIRINYTLSGVVYLSAGDYIEIFSVISSGSYSVDNAGHLSIALLG